MLEKEFSDEGRKKRKNIPEEPDKAPVPCEKI